MAKKKENKKDISNFENQKEPTIQLITDTLETNYMPYAMSVIISRAIPEIDGFKPSHRKLLYTMYKMGLLTATSTVKSANIVGATMRLNPHGDMAIYETLVRMTRAHEAHLHPLVDSKGSFGKHYSSTMAFSASRYTEAKLSKIASEVFRGIDKNSVDFVPNYDNTMEEPSLLPTAFPNILVFQNMGIAVGMATRICSFNLAQVCDATCEVLENPTCDVDRILDIMPAPDFSGGGIILYDRREMYDIYKTGRGSFKMRSKYRYDKKANCIEVIEIPDSSTIESILNKINELIKANKLKEVSDCRDEIGLDGFKLTIDLKKGVDPDKLMLKLFKLTPLENSISANFNVIIKQQPLQLGVLGIINEWIKFRVGCVRRECIYDLEQKKSKLHLLIGLGKILLDIDKAIEIIRGTTREKDVVANLMAGFSIDEVQAEYIAEIKLRHLNREYILSRVQETEQLKKEIAKLEGIISDDKKIKKIIVKQLGEIKEKYGIERKSEILELDSAEKYVEVQVEENYPVQIVMTREGYFKKITFQSLRGNDEQALKVGDEVIYNAQAENRDELLFFTDKAQCYKSKVSAFDTTKSSLMGDFVGAKLEFDKDEKFLFMKPVSKYDEKVNMIFIFENGKGVRVPITNYETKSNRGKLKKAYCEKTPIVAAFCENKEAVEIVMYSSDGKAIQISSDLIPINNTRNSQGVTLFSLKKNATLVKAEINDGSIIFDKSPKKIKIPAVGVSAKKAD